MLMLKKQVMFKPKSRQLDTDLKLKLCRKLLYTTTQVSYLAILVDDKLKWNAHANDSVSKLMRGNSISFKLRYVNKKILRTIYFAVFYSYLTCITAVWGKQECPKNI